MKTPECHGSQTAADDQFVKSTQSCQGRVEWLDPALGLWLCRRCAVVAYGAERNGPMLSEMLPVRITEGRPRCSSNGCELEAAYETKNAGLLFCAPHSDALPFELMQEYKGGAGATVEVVVSLAAVGNTEGWNLARLTQATNTLGLMGYRAHRLGWKDEDHKEVLVRLEDQTAAWGMGVESHSRIAELQEQIKAMAAAGGMMGVQLAALQKTNLVLDERMKKLAQKYVEQEQQFERRLADLGVEPDILPRLQFTEPERSEE